MCWARLRRDMSLMKVIRKSSGSTVRPLIFLLLAVTANIPSLTSRAADSSSCVASAKSDSLRCWEGCSGTGSRLERCTDQCETNYQTAVKDCSKSSSGRTSGGAKGGAKPTGGTDGCYFGECPEGLGKKIKEKHADLDEEKPSRTSPSRPSRQPQPPSTSSPVSMTYVCQTVYFWCTMGQAGPVNYPCWCASPNGPVSGVTIPQQ